MHATEGGFFSADDFAVASFVDFAAAMSTNVEARLNGDGDEIGETLEKTSAELSAFLGEFENFPFLLTHGLNRVFHQAFRFQLLEKRVN